MTTISRSARSPPSASSSVGASGVIPTAWNIATAPEDAAAAPSAFSRSSLVSGGSPTMTGTRGPGLRPHDVTDARGRDLVVEQALRDVVRQPEHDAASPVLVQVQAGLRHPSGDRRADVDEVAVAVRPRAQHRVGEHDRVRLGPGDVLAERRTTFELIRRAGPGRPAAHGDVGVHQAPSLDAVSASSRTRPGCSRSSEETFRVVGTATLRPSCEQRLGEVQPRPAVIQAAVDVRGGDVDQAVGLPDAGHVDQDPHGECRGLAATAVEHLAVVARSARRHRSE